RKDYAAQANRLILDGRIDRQVIDAECADALGVVVEVSDKAGDSGRVAGLGGDVVGGFALEPIPACALAASRNHCQKSHAEHADVRLHLAFSLVRVVSGEPEETTHHRLTSTPVR